MKPVRRRSGARRKWFAGLLILATLAFVALGAWQVQRRAWKHALIAAVDARVAAPAQAAPGPGSWSGISADRDGYRHVSATGHYVAGHDVLVRAVSDLGAGYWVMTPLDTGAFTVLINRGFIAQDRKGAVASPPAGKIRITGLLRISEPHGGFLRRNDPAAGQWYSRDIAAIAAVQKVDRAAPYFVDADAAGNRPGAPVGGLTVIRFPDNHAVYALTWFAMALLSAWGTWRVLRPEAEDDIG